MRKGLESVYDMWNIYMVICHTYSIKKTILRTTSSRILYQLRDIICSIRRYCWNVAMYKSGWSFIAYLPHVIEIDSLYVQSDLPHPLKWHAAISVSVPKHCKSSIKTGTLLEKLPKGESLFIIGYLKILVTLYIS